MQAAAGTPLNGTDPQTETVADAPSQARPRARPRRIGLLIGMAAFVIAADAISKAIVVAKMADRLPIRLLGGLLTLHRGRQRSGSLARSPRA